MTWGRGTREPYTECTLTGSWHGEEPPSAENTWFVTAGGSCYAIENCEQLRSGKWRFTCTRWPVEELPPFGERGVTWYAWSWRANDLDAAAVIDAFMRHWGRKREARVIVNRVEPDRG